MELDLIRAAFNKIKIKVNFKVPARWYFLGFLYHTAPADEKLTPDDAQFVDVIHSGGLWIGTDEPVSKQNTVFLQIISAKNNFASSSPLLNKNAMSN